MLKPGQTMYITATGEESQTDTAVYIVCDGCEELREQVAQLTRFCHAMNRCYRELVTRLIRKGCL